MAGGGLTHHQVVAPPPGDRPVEGRPVTPRAGSRVGDTPHVSPDEAELWQRLAALRAVQRESGTPRARPLRPMPAGLELESRPLEDSPGPESHPVHDAAAASRRDARESIQLAQDLMLEANTMMQQTLRRAMRAVHRAGAQLPVPSRPPGSPGAPAEIACSLCCARKKDTALVPCGHTACGSCARRLDRCPWCRSIITRPLHLWL